MCPSVGPIIRRSVGPLVMLLSAGRDEPANNLFRVYEFVHSILTCDSIDENDFKTESFGAILNQ